MILAALNDFLVTLAKTNPMVNEAFAGDVYDINAKENRFGCFVATPMTALRSEGGSITYTYTLYYIDRLTKDERNMDLVQSDAVTMLKGLIDRVEEEGVQVDGEYQFTLFRHNFDDWCAGAYVSIDFIVPDTDCGEFDFGVLVDLRPIRITKNGTYEPSGFDGFSSIEVLVPGEGGITIEEVDEEIDRKLVGYAKESWVEDKGYLTEHQPLKTINGESLIGEGNIEIHGEGGVTEEWVDNEIDSKLEGYVKTDDIPDPSTIITDGELNERLTDYATLDDVNDKVSNEEFDNYKDEVSTALDGKADKSEIPSLEGYATETWVNSQGFAKKTGENVYSGINKFEGTTTYFGNYYNILGRTYIQQNGDIYDKGRKLEDKYALKSEIPTIPSFKTINGESIIGEGDIEIHGGEVDLPDYLKDNYIEFTGEDEYDNTQLNGWGLQFNKEGYNTSYNHQAINIWNNNRELGISGDEEVLSASSGAYGSTWMGAIYMPGDEEPDHYGLQVLDVEGTHMSEFNNNGITFWDYDQTTEEGEVDWDNPTLTTISKDDLINIQGFNKDDYATKDWVEGKGYLTEHQDISGLATKSELSVVEGKIPSLTGYATQSWVEGKGYTTNKGTVTSVAVKMNGSVKGTITSSGTIDLGTVITEHQDISGKVDKSSIWTGTQTQWDALTTAQKSSYTIALIRE